MTGALRIGSLDSRGDTMVQGSPNVFVNGIAAARIGDLDSRGDTKTVGSTNVFIN